MIIVKAINFYHLNPFPNLLRRLAEEGAESKAFPPWGKRERGSFKYNINS